MKGKKRKDNKKERKGTRSPTELPTTSATATSRFNPTLTATATEQQVIQPSLLPLPTTSHIDSAQNPDSGPSLFPCLQLQGEGDVAPKLWTVEEVAIWLRSKGFNQDICDKFTSASSSCSSNIEATYATYRK
jgi:hypothetical protein